MEETEGPGNLATGPKDEELGKPVVRDETARKSMVAQERETTMVADTYFAPEGVGASWM